MTKRIQSFIFILHTFSIHSISIYFHETLLNSDKLLQLHDLPVDKCMTSKQNRISSQIHLHRLMTEKLLQTQIPVISFKALTARAHSWVK